MVINERKRMLNNREKSADQSKTVRFSGVVVINTYDQMKRASENRLNTENYKDEVPTLFSAIKEATKETTKQFTEETMHSKENSTENLGAEIENVATQMYEVMYIGKITVSESKAPPSFIDEAVKKFAEYENRKFTLARTNEIQSEESGSLSNSTGSIQKIKSDRNRRRMSGSLEAINTSTDSNLSFSSTSSSAYSEENLSAVSSSSNERSFVDKQTNLNDTMLRKLSLVSLNNDSLDKENNIASLRESLSTSDLMTLERNCEGNTNLRKFSLGAKYEKTATRSGNRNRTMLIGVGKRSVTLISPDRKSVILERNFKDISFCAQGVKQTKHFGFISREPGGSAHRLLCYVFQCASETVVEEIMLTLKKAFHSAFQQTSKHHIVCEQCPMHQLHKLCQQIEGLPPEKTFELLQRRINALGERDNNEIMSRLKNEGAKNIQEQVEVMMSKLRQMCEEKQTEHTHISDTSRTSGDFLLVEPNRGKLTNLRKAKKSLASSFENLFRVGKNKREDLGRERSSTLDSDTSLTRSFESSTGNYSALTSPESILSPSDFGDGSSGTPREGLYRPRSSTTGSLPEISARLAVKEVAKPPSSLVASPVKDTPRKNIFSKLNTNNNSSTNVSSPSTPSTPGSVDEAEACRNKGRRQSFRMGILNRVVTPAKGVKYLEEDNEEYPRETRKLSSQSCRALWRKAILETLLLIRMEKENITLQAHQDAVEIRRQKLDYEEITPCLKEVTKVWDSMLNTSGRENVEFQHKQLYNCVKAGVPRSRRGDIWQLLVEQHQLTNKGRLNNNVWLSDEYGIPYEDLLKQLTTHQHAILIDLGRTFPSHPYFSRQLGAGQLSLFNLLKAYSLIDKEVGYCQGLSFVAGILLMHMKESAAFTTLKYLMFHLGFRYQYKPDMSALQIKMYQLSRLLHDYYSDLYNHLERHEIAPTFYAAPWFLTLFASQFPLGFVARVFDLIFLQGTEVIYKVALVLLGNHKELIMQCNSFETIVEFLKTTLPEMGIIQMERIINQVFTLDITQQLRAYEVEYHVLQEEMTYNAVQQNASQLVYKLESTNKTLKQQNLELLNQLQISNTHNQSLEIQLQNMMSKESKLKSHIRTLELERAALLNAVTKLRKLLTEDVLDSDDVNVPSFAHDPAPTGSPLHYPAVDRILQEEGSLPAAGAISASSSSSSINLLNVKSSTTSMGSLGECDTEVATLTRSCNGSPATIGNSDSNRPSSAAY